jgi:hypothetical protein
MGLAEGARPVRQVVVGQRESTTSTIPPRTQSNGSSREWTRRSARPALSTSIAAAPPGPASEGNRLLANTDPPRALSGHLLKDVRLELLAVTVRVVATCDILVAPAISRRLVEQCLHLPAQRP